MRKRVEALLAADPSPKTKRGHRLHPLVSASDDRIHNGSIIKTGTSDLFIVTQIIPIDLFRQRNNSTGKKNRFLYNSSG